MGHRIESPALHGEVDHFDLPLGSRAEDCFELRPVDQVLVHARTHGQRAAQEKYPKAPWLAFRTPIRSAKSVLIGREGCAATATALASREIGETGGVEPDS